MKKAMWSILLAALAGLLFTACRPAEEVPLCGGVTDRTDHSAPKVIASKQISSIAASFWIQDEEGRGTRWKLSAKKDGSGGVSVSVEGAGKEEAQADSAFLDAVQKQGGMGTYAQIGSRLPAGHHSPDFDFDESLLQPAVELFCRVALELDSMD